MESIEGIAARLRHYLQSRESNTEHPSNSETIRCKVCNDTSYVMATGKAVPCECVIQRKVLARLPLRYSRARLLDFTKEIQDAILKWFENPGDGLLITGSTGTGKTHLAAAIVRTMTMIGFHILFHSCSELYEGIRECYRLNLSEAIALHEYCSAHMLVLDDLGAGSLSDHERRLTLVVLDRRLNRLRPTVVTTNWSIEQIAAKMDDRIASRLGSFLLFEMTGRDRRL